MPAAGLTLASFGLEFEVAAPRAGAMVNFRIVHGPGLARMRPICKRYARIVKEVSVFVAK